LLQVIDTLLLFYFIITLITKIKEIINILCSLWHFMIFLDLIFLKSKLLTLSTNHAYFYHLKRRICIIRSSCFSIYLDKLIIILKIEIILYAEDALLLSENFSNYFTLQIISDTF